MASHFTIRELRRIGGTTVEGEGDLIVWSSTDFPADGQRGGARAAPQQPWTVGGSQRTVRTDYPGARTPSEQVLGPRHEPFTLTGLFDDRWNYPGFAIEEMRRVEALGRRGNVCRVTFETQVFEGIVSAWKFDVRTSDDIGYELSVSVHDRPDDGAEGPFLDHATVALSPAEHFDNVELAVQAVLDASQDLGHENLGTSIGVDVDDVLGGLVATRDELGRTLDTRELLTVARPVDAFMRMASQFRSLQSGAAETIDTLIYARSDIELANRTALTVLDFESWSRSLRFRSALLIGEAARAERQTMEHADPTAIRYYQPRAGESLYAIAAKVYGSPHAWHDIAERNGLYTFVMTGDELLVIPERAA